MTQETSLARDGNQSGEKYGDETSRFTALQLVKTNLLFATHLSTKP